MNTSSVIRVLLAVLFFEGNALHAMEVYWPNDAAKTNAADVAFEGTVEKVRLPGTWEGLTLVTLKVQKVLKGNIEVGSQFVVSHEPGKIAEPESDKSGVSIRSIGRFRCPSFAQFINEYEYKVWASWNKEKQCYFVPYGQWAVQK